FGLVFSLATHWFDWEFRTLHGVDFRRHSPDRDGLIVVDRGAVRYVFYELDSLSSRFEQVMRLTPGIRRPVRRDRNRGQAKPYARLYAEFRRRFVPTDVMREYFHDSDYRRCFYPNASGRRTA
ncbi:MAG: putative capsular polysaccharide synthesis family protein, partial [Planctomycetales bacterium]